MTTIVWFRLDLRVADNPALTAAIERNDRILPLFIYSPEDEDAWPLGGASKWWLHHSLVALAQELEQLGSKLVLRAGPARHILAEVAKEVDAKLVLWNRRYEQHLCIRDAEIKDLLQKGGIEARSFNSALLVEPWEGCKANGSPYQVFTPYYRNLCAKGFGREPHLAPLKIPGPQEWPTSEPLEALQLLPKLPWARVFPGYWKPGTQGAQAQLQDFLHGAISRYGKGRDIPGESGTSRLSPHLHFGEIGPHQIVHAIRTEFSSGKLGPDIETYIKEIVWREFAHHLLFHFPHTPIQPLRKEFAKFPWESNATLLRSWQKGITGYPIVDAGMRELWATGWMHNRVRMIVASFLVKDLLISWQEGARWFWDTLVDADLASNTMGWQWASGCGADAAPYFRVFNPTLQGERFDAEGIYVKKWVPELKALPSKWIHKPWEAPKEVLSEAGVALGKEYPEPIVDHSEARDAALEAYEEFKTTVAQIK